MSLPHQQQQQQQPNPQRDLPRALTGALTIDEDLMLRERYRSQLESAQAELLGQAISLAPEGTSTSMSSTDTPGGFSSVASNVVEQSNHSAELSAQNDRLLRSWRHDHGGNSAAVAMSTDIFTSATSIDAPTVQQHEYNQMAQMQSPPVAQVVLDANENRVSSSYSYPVANFVTNLVRSSFDHIHTTVQSMDRLGVVSNDTVPIYVRTESHCDQQGPVEIHQGVIVAQGSGVPPLPRSHLPMNGQQQPVPIDFPTDSEPQYILVDGELIAMGPQSPRREAQQHVQTMVREQMLESNNVVARTCEPKKAKRGVRRLVKLFRSGSKGKKDKNMLDTGVSSESIAQQNDQQRLVETQQDYISEQSQQASTGDGPSDHARLMHQDMINAAAASAMDRHQTSAPAKQRKGLGLWKEKSKEKEMSTESMDSNERDKGDKKSRRWVGRRVTKKKPPPTTTPPRSQDFGVVPSITQSGNHDVSFANVVHRADAPVNANTSQISMTSTIATPPRPNAAAASAATDLNGGYADSILGSRAVDMPHQGLGLDGYRQYPSDTLQRMPISFDARATSVTASYVGIADPWQLQSTEGEALPSTSVAAESFLEAALSGDGFYSDYGTSNKKDDECDDDQVYTSFVPREADLKVDKADSPDVEDMLQRAVNETVNDLGTPFDFDFEENELHSSLRSSKVPPMPLPAALSAVSSTTSCLKSDRAWVPLSEAVVGDECVRNDLLKIVMVSAPTVDKSWLARALRKSNKRPKCRTTLAVEVAEWTLPCIGNGHRSKISTSSDGNGSEEELDSFPVKCKIWDVQGATVKPNEVKANFGVHPATQSLFFSAQSLYLLVWDLACGNPATYLRRQVKRYPYEDDIDDDDDDDDEFEREDAILQADRALHADISNRVLTWVDCVTEKAPMSAILPVALIPEGMANEEIKRRCDKMQKMLEEHEQKSRNSIAPPNMITTATENILCVHYKAAGQSTEPIEGIDQLEDLIAAIATDSTHSVFTHVGTPVPIGTMHVWDCIQRFRQEHKVILLDHLMGELVPLVEFEYIIGALHFLSSVGEILYFGTADDDVLSRYIILSHKWLVSALSCILRNNLKRELIDSRNFMNLQLFYSDTRYEENELIRTLVSKTDSNVPLLSDEDAKMLWQNHAFMREASDRHSQFEETSTTTPTMFYFLERLLVHSGVFLPLEPSLSGAEVSLDRPQSVFFVPSLLVLANPTDIWTYKNVESYKTTLCHSWLFRDGARSHLMEHLMVKLLRDLHDFSKALQCTAAPESMTHARSDPLCRRATSSFMDMYDCDQVGRVRIRQLMCWKSSLLIKIGTIFADVETGELRESVVEVFVAVCDQSSSHCVASEVMRPEMQRLIVSGKGHVGHHGKKLWKGGYKIVLDSVRASLLSYANVDVQVICPECLERSNPRVASTFTWDSVMAAARSGSSFAHCLLGHRVDCNLICGNHAETRPTTESGPINAAEKRVSDILPSVVVVALWDPTKQGIVSVGSGFVVDRKLGLIVTAGHVLFTFDKGVNFGKPYMDIPGAKVLIGVLQGDSHQAVFRYWADIVSHDINNVDACVVRILTRMENDVDDEGIGCGSQNEIYLTSDNMPEQQLKSLKLTKEFEIEESVRVLGYNQGGEGIFDKGKHVNRIADFAQGHICKLFKVSSDDSSCSSKSTESGSDNQSLTPREEIVVRCSTISGHSGGPCVNNDGRVIGILSRADPVDRQRCYLVPATALKPLISKAKVAASCARPPAANSLKSVS